MGWSIYTCCDSKYSLRKILQYEEKEKNSGMKGITSCQGLRVNNRRNEEEGNVRWLSCGETLEKGLPPLLKALMAHPVSLPNISAKGQ